MVSYYANLLKKQWKILVIAVSAAVVISLILSFLKPPRYVSTATILLADDASSISSSLGGIFGISNISGGGSSKDIIEAILKSGRMAKDVQSHFSTERRLDWAIKTATATAGLDVEVTGSDPALTEKIANFCIENLDKINTELSITTKKPMARVLDPAGYGTSVSRHIFKRILAAFLFVFFVTSFFIILLDHLKGLKPRGDS